MAIKTSTPARDECEFSAPSIMGVQLNRDDNERVVGWITPSGSSFFGKIHRSVSTINPWQCVIRCQGFTQQFGGQTPQGVADVASEKIPAFIRAFMRDGS